jgi:cell division protein FtsZ
MGGGTGTGAAPVIASIARELGILTVGIVTSPFQWEGRRRRQQAAAGIEELRSAVDSLLVINNDRLRDLYGNLSLDNAFEHADNVLTTAARGIAEIITETRKVNVDFQDVKTVMTNSGVAIMGMAEAEGEDRALRAAQEALASPLLNDNDIKGAKFVLLNITHGTEALLMDEIGEITDHIQDAAGSTADVIWGYGRDESLGARVRITVIATGYRTDPATGEVMGEHSNTTRTVIPLDADVATMITQPIANPVGGPMAPAAPAAPPAVEEAASSEPYLKPAAEEVKPEPKAVPQHTMEFEVEQRPQHTEPKVEQPAPPVEEKKVLTLYDDAVNTSVGTPSTVSEARMSPTEHQARVEERMARMREVHQRMRGPSGVNDMEREPAYKRKNVHLSDAPHSTDSNVSRYTLSEDVDETGERRVELKRNNPYLHDNVD